MTNRLMPRQSVKMNHRYLGGTFWALVSLDDVLVSYVYTNTCTIEYIPNVYNSTHSYMNSMMTLDSIYMGVGLEALFS